MSFPVRSGLILAAVIPFAANAAAQAPCPPTTAAFATSVLAYAPGPGITSGTGFGVPTRILCAPGGFSDVLTLGVGGSVTVGFASPIVDGPGTDFLTFENGFEFGGLVYGELAFVEVSTDGVSFARFPNAYFGPSTPLGPFDGLPAGCVKNLAGLGVPLSPPTPEGYANPVTGGGDPFDLEDLAQHPLVVLGQVNLQAIHFVRLVDILGDGSVSTSGGTAIFDPTSATASSDFDAVAVVHDAAHAVPGRPRVTVSFDAPTRALSIAVSDPDGLATVDWTTLGTTINDAPVDLVALLPYFPSVVIDPVSLTITSFPLPAGAFAKVAVTVADLTGKVGADSGQIVP